MRCLENMSSKTDIEINGYDFSHIVPALESAKASGDSDQPMMIIAHTIKGKGVHFTEGKHEWHSKVATKEELKIVAQLLSNWALRR